jgi:predicted negative regulator of RcsB-dependent stress response
MDANLPLILIEVVLVFGGVLAFGWWQLRDVKKAREQSRLRREAEARAAAGDPASPPDPPR